MDYFDWNLTGGADPNKMGIVGWGSGEMQNSSVQQTTAGMQQFKQVFQNLVGRPPTGEELSGFAQNALAGAVNAPGDLGYGDTSNLINNYIQSSFGPQLAQHQQNTQTQQLDKTNGLINNLVSGVTGNEAKLFSDPNSSVYQAFSGLMNNQGISPSSGAFQAGAGNAIAGAGTNAINNAMQSVGLPALSGIQNSPNMPFQWAGQNSDLGHLNQLGDFGLQASLAQMLANQSEPSGFEKNLGYAKSASDIVGNAGMASGPAMTATSYVCKELIKRGLICESDMDDFHVHIMPAMFKKGRAFWKYAIDGASLVNSANAANLNWAFFKPLLFDRVMQEPDPCKAVDLYATACKYIAATSNPGLWDSRVYRTSLFDSLPFLPRLLTYKPFLEALWKSIRVKMLFIYDKPKCEVHHGTRI